jgi:hypothetical protein
MYQLICHHTYKWGMAIDLSPYRNDGLGGSPFPHGASTDSGALRFATPDSRLRISRHTETGEPKTCWDKLQALKIEALFRLDPGYPHRVLISGHRSFAIMLGSGGFVWAGFVGPNSLPAAAIPGPSIPMQAPWEIVASGPGVSIPTGKWVTLEFEHNGFSRMDLRLDGQLLGSNQAATSIPSIGPLGVAIGNGNEDGGPWPLAGDLDEIKIWRRDPDAMKREFLGRPYTREAAQCWEEIGRAVIQAIESDPECMRQLLARLRLMFNNMMAALQKLDPKAQDELRALVDRYAALWFAGDLGSTAMAAVLGELQRFYQRFPGLDFARNSVFEDPFLGSECASRLRKAITLDCDPAIQAFLRLLKDSSDRTPANG